MLIIYIAADHRGFKLKEFVKKELTDIGYDVVDKSDDYDENDDYPDFAARIGREITFDPDNRRGILICGTGIGMDITVNKFPKVRSALVSSPDQAYDSRNDEDANVLSLAADYLEEAEVKKILTAWFNTPFSGDERHKRRIRKIADIESSLLGKPDSEESLEE